MPLEDLVFDIQGIANHVLRDMASDAVDTTATISENSKCSVDSAWARLNDQVLMKDEQMQIYWSYVDQMRQDNDEECLSFYKNFDEVAAPTTALNAMSLLEIEGECQQ